MYPNFIFDIGGVLLTEGPYDKYNEAFGSMDKAIEIWTATRPYRIMCDAGASHESMMAALEFDYPDKIDSFRTWYRLWLNHELIPVEANIRVLDELAEKKCRLYALTNWSSLIHNAIDAFPFFRRFEDIVISSKERILKPNPALYHVLLERNGLKAEECVFIDDNARNIATAEELGMMTVYVRPDTDLKGAVESIIAAAPDKWA